MTGPLDSWGPFPSASQRRPARDARGRFARANGKQRASPSASETRAKSRVGVRGPSDLAKLTKGQLAVRYGELKVDELYLKYRLEGAEPSLPQPSAKMRKIRELQQGIIEANRSHIKAAMLALAYKRERIGGTSLARQLTKAGHPISRKQLYAPHHLVVWHPDHKSIETGAVDQQKSKEQQLRLGMKRRALRMSKRELMADVLTLRENRKAFRRLEDRELSVRMVGARERFPKKQE